MCKNCDTCRHLIYDGDTDTYICKREDILTDNDVKCFEDCLPGCTQWEEDTTDYETEDAYFDSLGAFKEG